MSGNGQPDGPARISAGIAVVAAGVAAVTGLGGSDWWVLLAPLGSITVVAGLWRASPLVLATGCAGLVAATLVTGLAGGGPARLVIAVAATFVAWDLGEHAITLGEQLGPSAETARLELLHAAGALTAATAGTGVVYLTFLFAGGDYTLGALVFLVVGSLALLAALRVE